jgi:hypothetical protein
LYNILLTLSTADMFISCTQNDLYLIHDSHSLPVEKCVFCLRFGASALPSPTKFNLHLASALRTVNRKPTYANSESRGLGRLSKESEAHSYILQQAHFLL